MRSGDGLGSGEGESSVASGSDFSAAADEFFGELGDDSDIASNKRKRR